MFHFFPPDFIVNDKTTPKHPHRTDCRLFHSENLTEYFEDSFPVIFKIRKNEKRFNNIVIKYIFFVMKSRPTNRITALL